MDNRLSRGGIANSINAFENNASMYIPNKYAVTIYGEYVNSAIAEMSREIGDANNLNAAIRRGAPAELQNEIRNRSNLESQYWSNKFNKWLELHQVDVGDEQFGIELLWTCKNVNIPNTKPVIKQDFNIDSTKGISYPIITGVDPNITVSMSIIENRSMMMYQFFNALMNQFFNTQFLRTKSSFQKLNIDIKTYHGDSYVLPYSEENRAKVNSEDMFGNDRTAYLKPSMDYNINAQINNDGQIYAGQDLVLSQRFEFNSVVLSSISDLALSQDYSPLEFKVDFRCPNPFQKEFSETTEQGLRDLTTGTVRSTNNNTKLEYDISTLERKR